MTSLGLILIDADLSKVSYFSLSKENNARSMVAKFNYPNMAT